MLGPNLKQACQTPVAMDQRQVDAVDARSEVDLRVGAALTRFQTLTLQNSFRDLKDVISYGSCQFPTLGFVVDRHLKIRDFVPEEFWRIVTSYVKNGINVHFTWQRARLFDQMICLLLYERCMQAPMATVTSYLSRPTSKWRPLPLTTIELQKKGSTSLRLSSDRVMEAASSLYQKGFISYPRTETDMFDPKAELQPLIQKQLADPRWADYSRRLLDGAYVTPRVGKNNDGSHPPIHPTAAALGLVGDELKVYEFITRRFLAVCSDDAKGNRTTVEIDIAGEKFTAGGLTVQALNYLEIYPYEKWSDKMLPPFQVGETFVPTVLEMEDGVTTPPSHLSEAELITIMSRNGIGTDATIHEHIKKVITRKYVFKNNRQQFEPSNLGVGLVEGYDSIGLEKSLSKPFLRRELEHSLKGICEGTKAKAPEVQKALEMYFEIFTATSNNSETLIQSIADNLGATPSAAPSNIPTAMRTEQRLSQQVMQCPYCSGMMALRTTNEKSLLGCTNYPECHGALWFPVGKFTSISLHSSPCLQCQAQSTQVMLLKFTIADPQLMNFFGQEYISCIKCDHSFQDLAGLRMHSSTSQATNASRPTQNPHHAATSTSHQSSNVSIDAFRNALNDQGTSNAPPPKCRCGLFAISQQKIGQGENQGKWYYKCSAQRSCGFFSWIEGEGHPQRSHASSSNSRTIICFKCSQPGHLANACPQSAGNPSSTVPPGMVCYKCNQPGHFANSCTQSNDNPSASGVTCYKCQQPGHIAPDCPQNATSSRGSSRGRGSRGGATRSRAKKK
ncbi:DNA topoisomerase 3-alpha [Entomophthora muscae]|uniref:DNA topoisomerase 3-alpha n=1 Tax=Entomophthora muscae TaxID=34485 RepID=A0ACC2UFX5_9FUNG|nr:DNA topoisomerase 3-alpha [Entomophthora muscae]